MHLLVAPCGNGHIQHSHGVSLFFTVCYLCQLLCWLGSDSMPASLLRDVPVLWQHRALREVQEQKEQAWNHWQG